MKRKRNRNRQNDDVLANQADPLPAQPDSSSTQAVKDKFLAGRQLGASVSEAARWAGVPRATLYRWRRNDPDFAQAWNGSQDHDKVAQALEFEAYKRAIRGNDRLLVFLLKSYIPYTFNEKRQAKSLDQQEREAFYADFLESVAQKRAQAQKDFPQDDEDAGEPLDQDTEQTCA